MGKGEIACNKQFLLFSQFFHSYISLVHQNAALWGNGLIVIFQLSSAASLNLGSSQNGVLRMA